MSEATLHELRARIEALESSYETMRLAALEWGKDVDKLMRWSDQHLHRIEALEAGATCPHVVTGDEGTSYCALAEQQAAASAPPEPAPDGSLVERVADAIYRNGIGDGFVTEARAAIRAVAAALNKWQDSDPEQLLRTTWEAVRWLEQEAER